MITSMMRTIKICCPHCGGRNSLRTDLRQHEEVRCIRCNIWSRIEFDDTPDGRHCLMAMIPKEDANANPVCESSRPGAL
jgi:uncharacterized protein (DUF983 family)